MGVVNTGTLALGNNLALQYSSFNTASAGTLDPSAVNTPTLGGLTGGGNFTLPANVTSLTLNPQSGSLTYSGNLSGGAAGLALVKSGAGSQTLACHYLEWMDVEIRGRWTGLETLIMVSRDHGGPKSQVETHYYITSLKDEKAAKLQTYIRNHWAIENSCHWVLDTLFRADHNQTRQKNGAKNHSTMRRIAHNTLKRVPDHSKRKRPSSLPKKQLRAAQDETDLEQCLSLV